MKDNRLPLDANIVFRKLENIFLIYRTASLILQYPNE